MAPVGGVVDISSDEEDFLISDGLGSIDPAGWMADLFNVDDDATGEDFDDLIVMSEISAPPVLQQTAKADDLVFMSGLSKPALQKKANADGGCDEDEDDDECVVLDGDPDKAVTVADEEGSAGDGSSDELQIVAEKGPVACRDFPHSRHLCSNLPFSTTSHVKHCAMCHCLVCDTPAPCKYWGNSTSSNDHCHATDKEPKWKLMRQVFRSTQLPSSAPEKLPNDLYSTRHFAASQLPPSSLLHAGHPPLAIQSPLLNEGSQNQQRHHSVRVSLSVGGTVSSPRAGRGTCSAHIAQNTHSRAIFKRAGAVSPGFASKNASQFGAGCPDNSVMHQALPHVSQAAQVAPTTNAFTGTGTAQNNPFQRSFSAPIAYQVQQGQPGAYYQVAANGMDVIEPQLSRCTSLITERTQCLPEPVTDVGTKSWEDILATVASDLGVADYNISTTESPHVMTDSQPVHPTANQGFGLQHESVAAMENLMSSHMHDLSSHTTVSNVQANGPQEITENWDISGSSPVPNEAHLNDFASTPADVLSVEAAAHQLEVSRLDSTDILFEFDWS